MGVTGEGETPEKAFEDMKALYADFIKEANKRQCEVYHRSPRFA